MLDSIALLLTWVLAAGAPPPVLPAAGEDRPTLHPGPPVNIEISLDGNTVVYQVTGEQRTIFPWLGLEAPLDADLVILEEEVEHVPFPAELEDRLQPAIRAMFASSNPLSVDGTRVPLELVELHQPNDLLLGYGIPSMRFVLHAKCASEPQRVDVQWDHYEGAIWYTRTAVPVIFRSFGEAELYFFEPDEPGITWHRQLVKPRPRPKLESTAVEPTPARLPIPLVAAGLIVLLLVTAPLQRRLPLVAVGAAWLGGLGGAAATWTVARVELELPWAAAIDVPPPTEAFTLFEKLHRNVYAAFGARSEDEIWELLSASVDDAIVDELYTEIYRSLVMQGEGGAVCTIEGVDVEEKSMLAPKPVAAADDGSTDDAPHFRMKWRWQVRGKVAHWGHEHFRVNKYQAIYTVRHDGAAWKIANVDILDHSRVDRDG